LVGLTGHAVGTFSGQVVGVPPVGQTVCSIGHWVGSAGQKVAITGHWVVLCGHLVGSAGQAVCCCGHWVGTCGQKVTSPAAELQMVVNCGHVV
jgi:hypothetical protein